MSTGDASVTMGGLAAHRARSHRPASLRANFGWTFAGNVINTGCQLGVLVLIARLGDPLSVGRFALATAITTPIFLLAGMHLRTALATDAAGLFRFEDYFGVQVAGTTVAICGVAIVLLVAHYDRAVTSVALALASIKAAEGLAEIHHGFLQKHERMRLIAQSLIARGVLYVLVLGVVLYASGDLTLAIVASAVSSLAIVFAYDVRVSAPLLRASAQGRLPRLHAATARRIVAIAGPLGPVMLAVSLRTYLPRFFIEHRLGTAELGVFAALFTLTASGTLFVSAFGQSANARLAQYFHRGELAAFRRLLLNLVLLAAFVGVAGMIVSVAAGRPLLGILFGSAYRDRTEVLVWLMGAGIAAHVSSALGYALNAARQFRVQLPLFTATTLACAGMCAWLVPAYGLVGAACAWGASLLVEGLAAWSILDAALRRRAAGDRA